VTETAPAGSERSATKPRWPRIILISLAILLVLLVVAFFVAERLVRSYAEGLVKDKIVSALSLPSDDGIAVDLGSGYLLLQALGGSLDSFQVDIADVTVGELSGSAVVTATSVPLDTSAPVESADIQFRVNEEQLTAISSSLSELPIESVTLEGDEIRIGATLALYALSVPVTVGLLPGAADGDIQFTPQSIALANTTITADQLRDGVFGQFTEPLLAAQSICVASELPAALTLTDVRVDGSQLLVELDGTGAVIDDLATKGTCPA
jgi:uncharacterized protein YpmS